MGFEKALKEWRAFLRDEGFLVVSELCWGRDDSPEELRTFLIEEYPAIKTFEENNNLIEKLEYKLINHFRFSESAWWEYYNPLQKRVNLLRENYKGDVEANKYLDLPQREINLYKKYSKYYEYFFFKMQKL